MEECSRPVNDVSVKTDWSKEIDSVRYQVLKYFPLLIFIRFILFS